MNKNEFIKKVSEKTGLSQKDTGAILEQVGEVIFDCLKAGEKISISGFAKIQLKTKKARETISPLTNKAVSIPEKKVPEFKFSENFKEKFN